MSGCPSFVRGDRGTENTLVKELQQILMGNRRNGHGHSYLEGSSTSNQRIECFWGHLRKQCMAFWICKFHELQDSGDFVNDFVDKNILLFCFTAIIQDNLDSTMRIWNNHIIRRTNRGLPHGRPDVMCEAPYLYGTRSFLVPVTSEEVSACDPICVFRSSIVCDADIYRLCCIIMGENNLIYPKTPEEGFQLYFSLRRHLRVSLQL